MPEHDSRNAPGQAKDTVRLFSRLIADEAALARAEISRNLSRAGRGIVLVAGAALVALVALNTLAGALVAVLAAQGLAPWVAALIVAVGLLVVAAVAALAGKSRLSGEALMPRRTFDNLQRDFDHLKEAGHV